MSAEKVAWLTLSRAPYERLRSLMSVDAVRETLHDILGTAFFSLRLTCKEFCSYAEQTQVKIDFSNVLPYESRRISDTIKLDNLAQYYFRKTLVPLLQKWRARCELRLRASDLEYLWRLHQLDLTRKIEVLEIVCSFLDYDDPIEYLNDDLEKVLTDSDIRIRIIRVRFDLTHSSFTPESRQRRYYDYIAIILRGVEQMKTLRSITIVMSSGEEPLREEPPTEETATEETATEEETVSDGSKLVKSTKDYIESAFIQILAFPTEVQKRLKLMVDKRTVKTLQGFSWWWIPGPKTHMEPTEPTEVFHRNSVITRSDRQMLLYLGGHRALVPMTYLVPAHARSGACSAAGC